MVQHSAEVKEAILRCYEVFSAGDVEASMRLLTQEGFASGIGTDPEEWADTRTEFMALLKGWMTEPRVVVRLEASEDPRCFEEGSVGWVVDRPTHLRACGRWKRLLAHDGRHAPRRRRVETGTRPLVRGCA